jgi:hypothetical protein
MNTHIQDPRRANEGRRLRDAPWRPQSTQRWRAEGASSPAALGPPPGRSDPGHTRLATSRSQLQRTRNSNLYSRRNPDKCDMVIMIRGRHARQYAASPSTVPGSAESICLRQPPSLDPSRRPLEADSAAASPSRMPVLLAAHAPVSDRGRREFGSGVFGAGSRGGRQGEKGTTGYDVVIEQGGPAAARAVRFSDALVCSGGGA